MAFLAAENENRQLEDLPQADFVAEEKVINWQFFKLNITSIVCFCNDSRNLFTLSRIANALYDFSEALDPIFSFVNKVDFLVCKGFFFIM